MPHPSTNGKKGASSVGERPFPDLFSASLGSLAVPYRAQWGVVSGTVL